MTKPVTWRGGLRLTADSESGWVKVALIGDQGKVLATSRPVEGSVTDGEVHFEGSNRLEDLAGRSVRLRFVLQRAKLYSLCADAVEAFFAIPPALTHGTGS